MFPIYLKLINYNIPNIDNSKDKEQQTENEMFRRFKVYLESCIWLARVFYPDSASHLFARFILEKQDKIYSQEQGNYNLKLVILNST